MSDEEIIMTWLERIARWTLIVLIAVFVLAQLFR